MAIAEDRLEDIRMLRSSASAIAVRGDVTRARSLRHGDPGFDRAVWRNMAELGWFGLRVPVHRGGSGLGMLEMCALCEELGAALVPEPFIAATMAAQMVDGPRLEGILDGSAVVLPAWQERSRSLAEPTETHFDGRSAHGRKLFVDGAGGADAFVVTTSVGPVLVRRDAPGLTVTTAVMQDGTRTATLDLDGAGGEQLPPSSAAAFADAFDDAALATSAYLLGVIDQALAMTVDHLATRRQFGVPLASFQALRHAAADMKLRAELTRASVQKAAELVDAAAPISVRRAAVSCAKARAATASLQVTRAAIQLHGGIGYTDEHDIGLFLRKSMVLAPMFGGPALHRRRYAAHAAARGEVTGDCSRASAPTGEMGR